MTNRTLDNKVRAEIAALGIPESRIFADEPMSKHTSFRIGGPADIYAVVENVDELAALLKYLTSESIEHMFVGNGSNLLISDKGYRGVVIRAAGEFERIESIDSPAAGSMDSAAGSGGKRMIVAGCGALLSRVSRFACEQGLAGMEFASGIPGTIGGAIFMNAGAYGGEMRDIVKSVTLMPACGGEAVEYPAEKLEFSYRHSAIQESGYIVTEVVLELEQGDRSEIAAKMDELTEKRNSKQPVNYPSAGSTFKRPPGGFAAALIQDAGLKGVSVGGAQVSSKHSGFVINTGGATCDEVLALMRLVRKLVYEMSGIMLEPEVRIIGETL